MSASLKVVEVPRGSVLVLTGQSVADEDDLMDVLVSAIGHREFALLILDADASAEVWGPDVDLAAKVRELLGHG